MKRIAIVVGVLIAVVGLTWLGYATVGRRGQAGEAKAYKTVVVQRGSIEAVVNAAGSLEPRAQVALNFKVPGRLIGLPVQEGQRVRKGDVLARLDASDLEPQVAQAEASLRSAEARLRSLQAPPLESSLTAARAAVESAQAAYDRVKAGPSKVDLAAARLAYEAALANYQSLQAGPSAADLASAQATLEKAAAALRQAQAAYDQIASRPNAAMLPQALQLQQATIDYQAAKANYDRVAAGPTESQLKSALAQVEQARAQWEKLRESPSSSELKAAEQQLAQAKAQLDKLLRGPDESELIAAQAQVDQARASLEQARAHLDGATIRAPFAGVVASIRPKVFEQVSSATPILVLVDDAEFHLTVSVDEVDVAQVHVGDVVSITLNSFRDAVLTGRVAVVSAVPTIDSGVVSYPVTIALNPTDLPLRAGITANASIMTERRDGVLVIPNRAVQIDRTTGQLFVERLRDGVPERVEITTGLRNEAMSEVRSGLKEGDEIAIRTLSRTEQTRRRLGGG